MIKDRIVEEIRRHLPPNMGMTLGALFKHSASGNGNRVARC